jgi:hypothetical protein
VSYCSDELQMPDAALSQSQSQSQSQAQKPMPEDTKASKDVDPKEAASSAVEGKSEVKAQDKAEPVGQLKPDTAAVDSQGSSEKPAVVKKPYMNPGIYDEIETRLRYDRAVILESRN